MAADDDEDGNDGPSGAYRPRDGISSEPRPEYIVRKPHQKSAFRDRMKKDDSDDE
jgi:hypothetical protein